MGSFLIICTLSAVMIALSCAITYEVLRVVWERLPHMHIAPRLRALLVVIPILASHIVSIWLYALAYFLIENYSNFGVLTGAITPAAVTYESFVERLYFSSATYTSLWLGDIVPSHDLRMLAAAEVLNGLVMIGWTISFTYLTMEKFWASHSRGTHG